METLEDKVDKLFTDMYLGSGRENPSMTTRMQMQEDATKRIDRNLSWLAKASISTLLLVIGDILVRVIFK